MEGLALLHNEQLDSTHLDSTVGSILHSSFLMSAFFVLSPIPLHVICLLTPIFFLLDHWEVSSAIKTLYLRMPQYAFPKNKKFLLKKFNTIEVALMSPMSPKAPGHLLLSWESGLPCTLSATTDSRRHAVPKGLSFMVHLPRLFVLDFPGTNNPLALIFYVLNFIPLNRKYFHTL